MIVKVQESLPLQLSLRRGMMGPDAYNRITVYRLLGLGLGGLYIYLVLDYLAIVR